MPNKKLDVDFQQAHPSYFLNNEFPETFPSNTEAVIRVQIFHDRNLTNILQIPAELKESSLVRWWRQEENPATSEAYVRMSVAQKREIFKEGN